jgi:O-antigen/teichoic acid export membrane protein
MQKFINNLVSIAKVNKTLGKALSVSLLNQVVSSGTNFTLGIILVRILAPAEFGLYGIGLAISFIYCGVGNALFLIQMAVRTPDKSPVERQPYAARMFFTLIGFNALAVILFTIIFSVSSHISNIPKEYISYGMAVLFAASTYLTKDFFIRHSYIVQNEKRALANNLVVAITIFVFLEAIHFLGIKLTATFALCIYATGQLSGAFAGFVFSRLPYRQARLDDLLNDLRISWYGSRWALGGVTVTWLQSQAYMFITATIIGSAGVGRANAARLLISPFQFLIPAINQITIPRLAAQRNNDIPGMLKNGRRYTMLIVALGTVYCAALAFSYDIASTLIIGDKYANLELLVFMWCLVLLAQLARDGASTILQALKEFRIITLLNSLSAIIAIAAASLLSWKFGIKGAVLGTGIGEIFLAILLWLRVMKHV